MNQSKDTNRYQRDFFHGRLHEEQQKKRAKELLKAIRIGEVEALKRLQAVHPAAKSSSLALADAQLIIARENGFSSWPKLKAYCDKLRIKKERIASGKAVQPDTEQTLHIRCGSDIKYALDLGGFVGDFLEFSDPFCQGPITNDDSRLQTIRTDFISSAYDIPKASVQQKQEVAYAGLKHLESYERIVLWFEHDAYDQCILAYLLRSLRECSSILEFICVDSVPGISDFVGLGQLAPEMLLMLWEEQCRAPTEAELHWSTVLWNTYASGDIPGLWTAIQESSSEFRIMSNAFRRHIQELPSVKTGCSLTERLTLEILNEQGRLTGKELFGVLTKEYEPMPYLGDLMYWHALSPLLFGEEPLLQSFGSMGDTLARKTFEITTVGVDVLQGKRQLVVPTKHSRWFGGRQVFADDIRYDEKLQQPQL